MTVVVLIPSVTEATTSKELETAAAKTPEYVAVRPDAVAFSVVQELDPTVRYSILPVALFCSVVPDLTEHAVPVMVNFMYAPVSSAFPEASVLTAVNDKVGAE